VWSIIVCVRCILSQPDKLTRLDSLLFSALPTSPQSSLP
jgi:hypothetical protein